jgi:D-amino-acid oxidase
VREPSQVAVIGAGVAGLSSGVRLLETGLGVVVYAAALTPGTTSDVAGAYWYPFHVGPRERVERWSRATYEALARLAEEEPASGVSMREVVKLLGPEADEPWWGGWVRGFAVEPPGRYPVPYAHGHRMVVPLVETPVYMPWLLERFEALGGRVVRRRVGVLDELLAAHSLVVCCAGLGARELAGDEAVIPVRGRVVIVRRPPGLGDRLFGWVEGDRLSYIIPRRDGVLLGGTYEPGETSLAPDPAAAAEIRRRCAEVEPSLAGAQVLAEKAGLRPVRPAVRLELEERPGGRAVIHNYGHGGSGYTLSWGCAEEVAELARAWAGGGATG